MESTRQSPWQRRFRIATAFLMPVLVLYVLVGFLLLPWAARVQLIGYAKHDLGLRLQIERVRLNPFTFRAAAEGFDLREEDGTRLVDFERLEADLSLRSALDRVWTLQSITLRRPSIYVELRKQGQSNFDRLLEALGSGDTQDQPPPRLRIRHIAVSDGQLEVADLQGGADARIRVAPIQFEVNRFSTLESERSSYALRASAPAGGLIAWTGEATLNPLRLDGRVSLTEWHAATVLRMLGRWVRAEATTGLISVSGRHDVSIIQGGPTGRISEIKFAVDDLAVTTAVKRTPLVELAAMRVSEVDIDLGTARANVGRVRLDRLRLELNDDGGPDGWRAAIVHREPVAPDTAVPATTRGWLIDLNEVEVVESAAAISERRDTSASNVRSGRLDLRFAAQAAFGADGAQMTLRDGKLSMNEVQLGNGKDRLRFDALTFEMTSAIANSAGTFAGSGVSLQIAKASGTLAGRSIAADSASGDLKSVRLAAGPPSQRSVPRLDADALRLSLNRPALRGAGDAVDAEQVAVRVASLAVGGTAGSAPGRRGAITGALREVGISVSGVATTLTNGAGTLDTFQASADSVTVDPPSNAATDQIAIGTDGLRMTLERLDLKHGPDNVSLRSSALTSARADATVGVSGTGASSLPRLNTRLADVTIDLNGLDARRAGGPAASAVLAKTSLAIKAATLQHPVSNAAPFGANIEVQDVALALEELDARLDTDAVRVSRLAVGVAQSRAILDDVRAMHGSLELTKLQLDSVGGQMRIGTTTKNDTLRFGSAVAGIAKADLQLNGTKSDLRADGMATQLRSVFVRSPASGTELLRLSRADVHGAALRLRDRVLSVERLAVDDVTGQAVVGADGRLDWTELVAAFASVPDRGAPNPGPASAPWQVVLKSVAATKVALGYVDRRRAPALALGLDDISLRAANLQTQGATPGEIELTAKVRTGGRIALKGRLNLGAISSDLQVDVSDLALAAVQPFLEPYVNATIVSGGASANGRLRYGMAGSAGANLVYEGSLDVAKLRIEDSEPRVPLLTANALSAPKVRLTLGPDGLNIPELRASGLATRLQIAEDQTVNLARVMKPRPEVAGGETKDAPFVLAIDRIRFEQGQLEFADRSLKPQFAVRVHQIRGTLTGVSTTDSTPSRLQLEGRVDKFGFARFRGDLKLLAPQEYAKLGMTFRNLEMTALTPYVAKFAGYRVASGKLSLDLDYTLQDKRLIGKNRIVLDKLELGEKVDSPSARDLPLELAIALLKDDRGRIDIGLPVEGSLEDPKFDIGELIGRAVGNLIGSIVTAPFKLLAAVFGGSADQLDHVSFDAGSARLLPPEQEKLRTVATALAKRPQLALTVKPGIAVAEDSAAMRLIALRHNVLTAAGMAPDTDDDPGPLNFGDPRMQRAIDKLYIEQLGLPELRDRRAAFEQLAASESPAASESTASDRTRMMYRNLFEHLLPQDAISDQALEDLGRRRGEAILNELTQSGGIPPQRMSAAAPNKIVSGSRGSVDTDLELGTSK